MRCMAVPDLPHSPALFPTSHWGEVKKVDPIDAHAPQADFANERYRRPYRPGYFKHVEQLAGCSRRMLGTPAFKPKHAWVIITRAHRSALRSYTDHDLYERSSPSACPCVGGFKAGGVHLELPKRSH